MIKNSSIILGLLIFFHLAMADSLHTLYDATGIGNQIRKAQAAKIKVAVFPARLSDQLQFSGRLVTSLVAQQNMGEAVIWSKQNPEQAILLFLDKETSPYFSDIGIARPYKNGWLIFRSTNGFYDSYKRWIMKNFP
jgi:hypothetical protein